jgi:peptide/nickel transport system permease protein
MGVYILKRIVLMIPVVLILVVIVFFIVHLLPGDPIIVMLGREATPEAYAALQHKYGFDRPLLQQFSEWFGRLLRFDWGDSLSLKKPVLAAISERLPRSLAICVMGIFLSLLISVPAGIISAVRHNSLTDMSITTITLLLISLPSFWLGIILMIAFSIWVPILPSMGYVSPARGGIFGSLRTLILPVITVAAANAAATTRLLRASMLEVLNEDYIMLSRIKNNPERRTLLIHALRNAAIPVFTTVSMQAAYVLGGEVIVEKVFAIPGLGQLILNAIEKRDYPLIQGCVLTIALIVVVINLITDLLYAVIDPRIKYRD